MSTRCTGADEQWFMEDSREEVAKVLGQMDPTIVKAYEIIDELSRDPETVRLYELREKTIHDDITRMEGAKEEGIKEGIKEGKINVAKNLINIGLSIDKIKEATGLTEEEIKEIK